MSAANPELAFDERLLPPSLSAMRRILRAIGPNHTIALLKARGGTRLHLVAGPLLHELIGTEATQALLAAFPDQDEISLPKADKLIKQIRDRLIRAEKNTKSLTDQALEHDLTARQITNIRRADPPKPAPNPQPDLFGADETGHEGI